MAPKKSHNKSAFVRSLPAEMSAKDVVAKAKEEGLTLTESYVHTIRSAAKRKAGSTVSAASPRASSSGDKASEAMLMDLIIEHGLPAVQRMVEQVAAKLRSRL
jgi:hypothetical protein